MLIRKNNNSEATLNSLSLKAAFGMRNKDNLHDKIQQIRWFLNFFETYALTCSNGLK